MVVRVLASVSAAARLDAVVELLAARSPGSECLIVAASRGAADDVARRVARQVGATFGLTRFSFSELAARLASSTPGDTPRIIGSPAGAQAAAARAAFDAVAAHELAYLAPVATLPGFPTALARTLHELRLARVDGRALADGAPVAVDLARLLARVEHQLADASVLDRAALFERAAAACATGSSRWVGMPVVLLDVPLDAEAEAGFARALLRRAATAAVTVPSGDDRTLAALASAGAAVETLDDQASSASDLWHLRRFIFTTERPPVRDRAGDVHLFSAPGEGREAVEIVRRLLDEAAGGVPFDEMAVFLRAPQQYLGLLEHACARADVPVYFDRGTRRPDPAGRAFLALLACATEGLSARRFDEYLSLGQVPRVGETAANDRALAEPVPPRDELFGVYERLDTDAPSGDGDAVVGEPLPAAGEPGADSDDDAVVYGTLRAPWKWEELIVESAVIAGRDRPDGAARWRRRLRGLKGEFETRLAAVLRDDPESGRAHHLRRDLVNLAHLTTFALPIIEQLADWPDTASWGEWLERFTRLAARALKRPTRVQQLLAELRPMAAVSGVTLDEAARVLHDRLATLEWEPPARRYGRVFVGTPHQARGRVFRVVFVPGLAERVVPQRPREDPLLLDERRDELAAAAGLLRQDDRARAERLLLKVAIGAAGERVYLSYPRLDSNAEGRARVPSFYALDVMRAITGRVPDHRVLARDAAEDAGASLGWPAPADPDRAIDDLEHDLAVLRPLLDARDIAAVKGRAHYMLGLNPALQRSITGRWLRDKKPWSKSDGLVATSPLLAPHLAAQRLGARPYSLSALQRFATCPYQFLLGAMLRLEPWSEPEPLVRLDALTRGSLYHAVQADFQREMHARGALPMDASRVAEAVTLLEAILERVAGEYHETLAPAIERVWHDEIADLRRDLSIWVQRMADEREWVPEYFEWSFGLKHQPADQTRDPRSSPDPVTVADRFVLRGSVDLIERHHRLDVLRVTDHKTGRNRSNPDLVVGGGTTLQPVLYSLVVEQALQKKVVSGRLYYSTTAGGFADKAIDVNDYTRGQGIAVLTIIDRAVEQGFLVAAPAERACAWCDFRPVCGPHEQERAARKASDRLGDLDALRSMR